MNRISVLLILLFTPIGIAAQQSFPNKAPDEKYSFDEPGIKTDHESQNRPQIWLNLGLGRATPGPSAGIASISYQFNGNLLSLRASTAGEFLGDHFSDTGFLYGRAIYRHSFHFSIAAGLARVTGQRSEGLFGSTADVPPSIGLPLELQSNWRPTNFIGVGLTGFANINPEQSFAGLTLAVQVGKLR